LTQESEEFKIKFNPRDFNILNKIAQSYSPVLVGEESTIKFLFCGYVSKDLPRRYRLHTIIASQSSAGKTSLVRKVGEPFAKYMIDYTNFTGAFLKRQQESMDGKILLLEQLEKTNDQDRVSVFDLKFLLSEGKIKVGVAERDEKGKFVPTVLEVTGIPVVVTTSTNMRIDPETLNRMFLTQADESIEQTQRIVDFTLKSYSTLKLNNTWKEELEHLIALAEKYRQLAWQISDIIIPFGDKLKKIIPSENLTIRRDLPKILSLTSVIAFIHAANRYRVQDNVGSNFIIGTFGETEKRFKYSIIAEPDDFREALEIAGSAIKQTLNKVNETSMNLYGKILEMYDGKTYECATLDGNTRVQGLVVKEIAAKIGKSANRTRELISQLEEEGYLIRDRTSREHAFTPSGKKFDEIKVEDLTFTKDDLDVWILEQTARHGQRLEVIPPPSCNNWKIENGTK
jgi:hypothetical protein